jgi:hypothetical protein
MGNEHLIKIPKLRAMIAQIQLAAHTPARDIFKKNEINREVKKDTAGNSTEQDMMDSLSRIISKHDGSSEDDARRRVTKGMRKMKTNKKTGERSFTL